VKIKTKELVRPGTYDLEFIAVSSGDGEYGPTLTWTFTVVGGQYDGRSVTRITAAEATGKNAAGKLLCGVTGEPFEPGKEYDLDAYIGRRYHGMVELTDSGYSRVTSVVAKDEK
jgi:hypothetical protein